MTTETGYISPLPVTETEAKSRVGMRNARSSLLFQHFYNNAGKISFVILIGLVSSGASFLLTVIIGNFFSIRFGTNGSKTRLADWLGLGTGSLNTFFLLFALLLLVKFFSNFLETYLTRIQGEIFVQHIRNILFNTQLQSSTAIFKKKSFGNYLLRYSNDMKTIQNYLTAGILGGIKELLFFCGGPSLLFKINWQLTVILIPLFFCAGAIIIFLSTKQKRWIKDSRDKRSNLLSFVTRHFSRFEKIKKENSEALSIDRYLAKSQNLFDANRKNHLVESFILSLGAFLQFFIIGFLLWLLSGQLLSIAPADGLVIILILMLMQGAVRRLLKVPGCLNKGGISLKKITELLNK